MEVNHSSETENGHGLDDNAVVLRNGTGFSWRRPSSIVNLANDIVRRSNPVLESTPLGNKVSRRESAASSTRKRTLKRRRNAIVNIVLVEAKGLPDISGDGASHGIHCKFRLGSQTFKSKSVQTTRHPQWKERFKLNCNSEQLLEISLWDKGKQKNFMGSCVLDLSARETERTHDIWLDLDDGYGSVHLSVTICTINDLNLPSTPECNEKELRSQFAFYNVKPDLEVVGQLHVKVIGARGLHGKPNAYCTLELDNQQIQTPTVPSTAEPVWNKNYIFNIYDVTSVLELKVYDSSINSFINDSLGRVSIPLLRIADGESRWYALKDSNKRRSARGNCPRVRLQMSLFWNPVTASLKLFRPKQVKYTAKPPKFDIPLVYKNVKFIRDTFDFLYRINESFKRLFEWEDRELSYTAIVMWLLFWYFFESWMGPLFILGLFPLCYIYDKKYSFDISTSFNSEEPVDMGTIEDLQNGDTVAHKIKGLPEMTFTITDGIEYMVSVAERLYKVMKCLTVIITAIVIRNYKTYRIILQCRSLVTFKVPYISYLTMVLLLVNAGILYCIPTKYLMMTFGLYKFLRKRIYPDRVLNNDLLDFISRIPDNKILKDWKELSVPEPQHYRNSTSPPMTPSTPTTPNLVPK